jgi:hypothetical protein
MDNLAVRAGKFLSQPAIYLLIEKAELAEWRAQAADERQRRKMPNGVGDNPP